MFRSRKPVQRPTIMPVPIPETRYEYDNPIVENNKIIPQPDKKKKKTRYYQVDSDDDFVEKAMDK